MFLSALAGQDTATKVGASVQRQRQRRERGEDVSFIHQFIEDNPVESAFLGIGAVAVAPELLGLGLVAEGGAAAGAAEAGLLATEGAEVVGSFEAGTFAAEAGGLQASASEALLAGGIEEAGALSGEVAAAAESAPTIGTRIGQIGSALGIPGAGELGEAVGTIQGFGERALVGDVTLKEGVQAVIATGKIATAVTLGEQVVEQGFNLADRALSTYTNDYGIRTREVIMNDDGTVSDPFKLGTDLGTYLGMISNELNTGKLLDDAIDIVNSDRPDLAYMAAPVIAQLESAQINTLDYPSIRETYNGRSITREQVFETPEGWFGIRDETGESQIYDSRPKVPIPTLHGVYCGPYSRNDTYPIDLLDTFCLLHDVGYLRRGFFDRYSDLQLLSRIEQNIDRMEGNERNKAMIVHKYFSTMGHLLAKMKTKFLPGDIDEEIVSDEALDIFRRLYNSVKGKGVSSEGDGRLGFTASQLNERFKGENSEKDFPKLRTKFYSGLRQGLVRFGNPPAGPTLTGSSRGDALLNIPIEIFF